MSCPPPPAMPRSTSRTLPGRPGVRQGAGLLVALAALAAPVRAQDPLQPGLAVVRGVVYDSLAGRPLAGARVSTADGLRAAIADTVGRFMLDSVTTAGAPVMILAEHPAADSVGLSTLAAAVRLAPGDTASVTVALPSYATLRAAVCAGIPDAGDQDGGILVGTVRDAAGEAPVAGAVVAISWVTYRGASGVGGRQPPQLTTQSLDAFTDGAGAFYACGLPTGWPVTLRAAGPAPTAGADSLTSGDVSIVVGERRILRRDLLVGDAGRATIIAQVLGRDGRALAGAKLFVEGGGPAVANDQGRAVLRDVPTGTRQLGVRMIGFTPADRPVDLAAGDTLRLELQLDAVPQQLEAVRVRAARLREGVERRRRLGFGRIITGDQLASSPTMTSIFHQVPGVRAEGVGAHVERLQGRRMGGGWCTMAIYVDGRRTVIEELQMFETSDLAAVEVYARGMFAPVEYVWSQDMAACGVVLAWTKR